MINTMTIFITKPLGVELSVLGLRTAWACHEKGIDIQLVLIGDGVWCATEKTGYHTEMIKKLIDNEGLVYCVQEDIATRGIKADKLIEGIQGIAFNNMSTLCITADTVSTF